MAETVFRLCLAIQFNEFFLVYGPRPNKVKHKHLYIRQL